MATHKNVGGASALTGGGVSTQPAPEQNTPTACSYCGRQTCGMLTGASICEREHPSDVAMAEKAYRDLLRKEWGQDVIPQDINVAKLGDKEREALRRDIDTRMRRLTRREVDRAVEVCARFAGGIRPLQVVLALLARDSVFFADLNSWQVSQVLSQDGWQAVWHRLADAVSTTPPWGFEYTNSGNFVPGGTMTVTWRKAAKGQKAIEWSEDYWWLDG